MSGSIIGRQPVFFLGMLLGLLTINIALLVWQAEYHYDDFSGIVVCLILILNHIAYHLVKSNRWSVPLKNAAIVWSSAGLVYMISIFFR